MQSEECVKSSGAAWLELVLQLGIDLQACFHAKAHTEMLKWETKRLSSYVKFAVLHNFNEWTKSCAWGWGWG